LRAIQFVDRNEGWAVGDEGVVWHTIDGGQNWELQPTGVRASLRAIHFLDPYHGWIAGREELPDDRGSVGCLLYTRDGGLKWQQCGQNILPGLNVVRFLDDKVGFAAGDGTDSFPSGLFATRDGGRTWKPVAGKRTPSWFAADFKDGAAGVLAGAWGTLAPFQNDALGTADMDTVGGRGLRAVVLDGSRAVAVGQGGAILLSGNGGIRWGYAETKLPAEVLDAWDFHAVHTRGDSIWMVGRPGSAVLHSRDWGKSWEVQKTGQSLPLHSVFFLDSQRGWAVGELGCILATADGGKTWKAQHRGGLRAGILFVHARSLGLPVDTVAAVGGQEGYLAAALRVQAPDSLSAAPVRAAEEERWSAAVCRAGGAAGEMLWQFPVPQHLAAADRRAQLGAWDRLHSDRAAELYLRQLVLALRIWKPAVIVTDHPDVAVSRQPGDALLAEALHEAFVRAADPAVFPEQIQMLGLEPWQAQKLYGVWEERATAQVVLDLTEVASRLETSYAAFAEPSLSLLTEGRAGARPTLPGWRAYRLLDSRLDGADRHGSLMEGVALAPGGTSRRESASAELKPEALKAVRARRNLELLAQTPLGDQTESDKLLAQLGPALAELPKDQASEAVFVIGSRFARAGQWLLAREVFLYLVDRYPTHGRAADACRWLIQHGSSSEARRRLELGQFVLAGNLAYQPTGTRTEIKKADLQATATERGSQAVKGASLTVLGNLPETRNWYQGSLAFGERLAAFGPLYAADPALQFSLNSARRQLGDFESAKVWYTQFRNSQPDGPWRAAAAAELWLSQQAGPAPKPLIYCRQTSTRPFLDGKFDDACWENLKPVVLRNAAGETAKECATEVRLAYDQNYFYLALRCTHPEAHYAEPVQGRQRDADLRPFDRVSLMLDLDRDYASYYHFQVDQRGCVRDECGIGSESDASWNPRWFVAVQSEKASWQIEAAIPLVELTGDKITLGKAWACNLVRVLPGRGVQALSLPADVEPRPEGMGLVIFVAEQMK
jgi:photosystem II stability/assembly factor-like uncharacterized protein